MARTPSDLANLPMPEFVDGVSLRKQLDDVSAPGHPAVSYHGGAKSIRTDTYRLILHNNGHAELYDHTSEQRETNNVAESHPGVVKQLAEKLHQRLDRR